MDKHYILTAIKSVYFWDTDVAKLDIEKNAAYIIRRVFELGDIEEIAWIHAWYGKARCKEALLTASYLREAAIIQGMVFLDIPDRNLFKSAKQQQYHRI